MADNVFVSYARADGEDFAKKLHDHLEANGFMTWLDRRDIKLGENWDLSIDKAIRECWALLFVMTPSSVDSPNCHDEWSRALSFKKPVLPLLVRPCVPPMRLHRLQYIDFTGEFDRAMLQLCDHLRWMQTNEGELQALEDRLGDLRREVANSDRPDAVQAEIAAVNEQIAYKRRAMDRPDEVLAEYRQATEEAIDAERKRLARAREQDLAMSRRRVLGSAPQGVSDLFRDRAVEMTTIIDSLQAKDADIRAVSVYGMGGVGKTALACKVMQELEKDHKNVFGLMYLSTRSAGISLERVYLDSARMLGGASEQALNEIWADQQSEITAKIQKLLEHYGEHRCIILLDNMEDLLDASGKVIDPDLRLFLDSFLRQRHEARLLITSREPLSFADSSRRYEKLTPLDQGLPVDYAVDLLKAFDRDGQLGLADAEPALLQSAVAKTHGYPRALEAIAGILAQDPFMSLPALLEDQDLFDEQVTVKLVQEAQSRLDGDARRVMQALAVYGRPVREAAVRFLLEPYATSLDIGATLRRLARGRYITVKRGTNELVLHPLDKDYSYKQIPTDSTDDYNLTALERRAASYYVQLRTPPETWKGIRDLEPQLAEFEHRVKAHDYDAAAQLIGEIDRAYLVPWGHARRVLNMREQLLGKITDRALEEGNLGQLGLAYHSMGKVDQAAAYYRQALAIAREIGDRSGEATRLGHLGIAYSHLGQIEQAIDHYRQALAIAREISDRRGEGRHLGNLGLSYRDLGQVEQAIDSYQQALAIAREIGNRQGEGHQLGNLGIAYRDLGQIEQAIDSYQQALVIAREIGDRTMEEYVLGNLGECYLDLGDAAQAIDAAQQALVIARDIDDSRGEGYMLNNLGKACRSSGSLDQSIQYLRQALAIATEIHEPVIENHARANLARAYLHLGQLDDALAAIADARRIDLTENNHVAAVLHGLILARLDRREAACAALGEARTYADEFLSKTPRSYLAKYARGLALSGLGLLANSGEQASLLDDAKRTYQDAYENCSARGVVGDALKLLDELRLLDTTNVLSAIRAVLTG